MENKGKKYNWKKGIYWFVFAVSLIIIYKTLDNFDNLTAEFSKLVSILMPFFMGLLISALFYIPCKSIEILYKKTKIKFINKRARGLAIVTVYLLALLVLIVIINLLIPALSKSIRDLAHNLPTYYQNALEFVNNLPEKSIIKKSSIQGMILDLQQVDITSILSLENISDYIEGVIGVANAIFGIFISLIVSIYILIERDKILKFINKLIYAIFKDETCKAISNYFVKASDIFFKFISSQLLDAIIVGIIVSIAMWILGVKYWILLGFMIGLFNIIPYFGSIIAIAIATIITILTGGFSKAIWMFIAVVIIQQIDANIINPKIVGNALKLSPILVIFSVSLFGAYFKILGMFLAVPVIAIIKIIVNDFIDYRIKIKNKNKDK